MTTLDVLEVLPIANWQGPFDSNLQTHAMSALEDGKVVLVSNLPFAVLEQERQYLDQSVSGGARKNISLDPRSQKLSNSSLEGSEAENLKGMLDRFADITLHFIQGLLPAYAPTIEVGRTSFRPNEISQRASSPRQDDSRFHVDAFPSRPLRGRRILRIFSNVAIDGAPRIWQVGEPFPQMARKFLPGIKAPLPGSAWLYERTGITKGRRSPYDHYMLGLHDRAKLDEAYQSNAPRTKLSFPPGAAWLCFTDQVMHAALSGHCALEQTFYLPVNSMGDPAKSPLRILEGLADRILI